MGWFAVRRGALIYRGRITGEPFEAWLRTPEGASRLGAEAAKFRVFAAARARRRLWQPLDRALRSGPLRKAAQEEVKHFRAAMSVVSYAPGLPRTHVALHRLVVVPRPLVAARARSGLRTRIWTHPALEQVDDDVRAFFCEQLLIEMDKALERARPAVSRPIEAHDGWWCVGADRGFPWVDPLWSGQYWAGHFFMYELPRAGLSRAERRELEAAVAELQSGIGSLSRLQREALVRSAALALTPASTR